ncbi:MAG: hypothetical protein ACTHN8_08880 [Angustibacter sp.]
MRSALRGLAAVVLAGVSIAGTVVASAAPVGPVSTTPAAGTPSLTNTGTTQTVRQLVPCGGTMYAVGAITSVTQKSVAYPRYNVFSFSETKPFTLTSFAPVVNGVVNSIAFVNGDCTNAYIGGQFSTVNGVTARNIAKVNTQTGQVDTTFARSASAQVSTLLGVNGHLLVGGYFQKINGSARPYMASLDPVTGRDDGYVALPISGNYVFPGVRSNPTRVYNFEISNSGDRLLVMGDFTSVGGQHREQIFMLALGATGVSVTGWTSNEFYGACATVEPFYLQAAAWSPDDSAVYVATTGYKPYNLPAGSYPRSGLCDAAAAFPATETTVSHTWINYTGCDSLYSVTADTNTVYIGGHERWASNPNGCDFKGPGAVAAPGMAGLSPSSGSVVWNPGRARGHGADDMIITGAGLWIASDNLNNANLCAGKYGHAGICFLPY